MTKRDLEEGPMSSRCVTRKQILRAVAASSGGRAPEATPGQADIAAVHDVAPNSAVAYTNAENGLPEVLVHLPDGRFVAYSAVCSHQGCTVAYRPQVRKLVCPCHGGVYDPARGGAVVSGPPPLPLAKVKIEVRNGKVFRIRLLRPVSQQRS
jgi:Rieske Fe-S protein